MKQSEACILCQKNPRRKGGKYCKSCHNASMRTLRQRKKEQLADDLHWLVIIAERHIKCLREKGNRRGADRMEKMIEGTAKRQNVPRGT